MKEVAVELNCLLVDHTALTRAICDEYGEEKAKILSAKKLWKKYRKNCCINKLVMSCLSGITRRFNSRLMNLKRGDKR